MSREIDIRPTSFTPEEIAEIRAQIPPDEKPSPVELRRRRRIFEETMAVRALGKPPTPGNTVEDYLRLIREQDDPS